MEKSQVHSKTVLFPIFMFMTRFSFHKPKKKEDSMAMIFVGIDGLGINYKVRDVRARVLTDMAWLTMRAVVGLDNNPFIVVANNPAFFGLPRPEPTHLNHVLGALLGEHMKTVFHTASGIAALRRLPGNHWLSRLVEYSYSVFVISGMLLSVTRAGSSMWLMFVILRIISFLTTIFGVIWIVVTRPGDV